MTANFDRNAGKGRLALDRYDFEDHTGGANRRHSDDQIDLSDGITEISATNVHEALVEINNRVLNSDYFVTIGADLDIYIEGVFQDTADAAPSLDAEFIEVFTNTSSARYQRLRDGGILLIKSGTYKITSTIDVPPGIHIMGEGFGTKLLNRIVANGGVESPMFRFKADLDRAEDQSIVSLDSTFDPLLVSKTCKLTNLVIADNYVRPVFFGDTVFRTAQNTTLPLIYVELGAGLECEGVTFLGRSVISDPAQTTHSAIGTDPLSASSLSSVLKIHNCSFDGFNRALTYTPLNGTLDYFEFKNNKVRVFGPVGGVAAADTSNVLFLNACNIDVSNNYIWTDGNLMSVVYMDVLVVTVPPQPKAKIIVCNNTFAADKSNVDAQEEIVEVLFNASIQSDVAASCSVVVAGNNYDTELGYKVQTDYSGTDNKHLYLSDATAIIAGVSTSVAVGGNATTITLGSGYNFNPSFTTITHDTLLNLWSDADLDISAASELTIDAGSFIEMTTSSTILVSSTGNLTIESQNNIILTGGIVTTGTYVVSTTPYVVDDYHYILLVQTNTIGGPSTVNLPAHVLGRTLIVKDSDGYASSNPITLARNGSSGNIDDYTGDRTISTDWASWTLVSDGTNWLII